MERPDACRRTIGIGVATLALIGGISGDVSRAIATENAATNPKTGVRPNFVFILMDDLGYGDLGCFGHPLLRTPNIDKLADEGCRFTDFYVPMPLCSPTRAGCLTGRDPNRYGFKHVINLGMVNPSVAVPEIHHLPVNEPTLPRQLQKVGYRTGTIGKWHLSLSQMPSEPKPRDYGFDYCFIHGGGGSLYHGPAKWEEDGELIESKAAEWYPKIYIDKAIEFVGASKGKPFYLNIWPFAPHVREEADEKYRQIYSDKSEAEKTYFGCITQMDEQFGRLFDFLKNSGLWDNTVIVFASDNGPEPPVNIYHHEESRRGSTGGLRGAKHVIYEGGIRTPGIMRWPGLSKPGSVSNVPVSVLDLMPTICAAAGATLPAELNYDGADMRAAFKQEQISRPHALYWQCEYSTNTFIRGFTSPPLAIREGSWKLMCNLDFKNVRLTNLDWDRGEQWNIEKEHPEIVAALLEKLKGIYADINGPQQMQAQYLNPELLRLKKVNK